MRTSWAVFKTCFAASILGGSIGVMVGLFIVLLTYSLVADVMERTELDFALPFIVILMTALGAGIAAVYCKAVIKESPDEWIGPQEQISYCTSCHYELLHNASGHCPECGKVIPEEQLRYIRSLSGGMEAVPEGVG